MDSQYGVVPSGDPARCPRSRAGRAVPQWTDFFSLPIFSFLDVYCPLSVHCRQHMQAKTRLGQQKWCEADVGPTAPPPAGGLIG